MMTQTKGVAKLDNDALFGIAVGVEGRGTASEGHSAEGLTALGLLSFTSERSGNRAVVTQALPGGWAISALVDVTGDRLASDAKEAGRQNPGK